MNEKNPYENDTIDVPNFSSKKVEDSASVDMSIFKMSEEELMNDEDDELDEDLYPKKNGKKVNVVVIVLAILAALLLALSIFSIIGKSNADKAKQEAEAQVAALQGKVNSYETTINSLNAKITELEKQITEAKNKDTKKDDNNSSSTGKTEIKDGDEDEESYDGSSAYVVVNEEGVNLREKPNSSADIVASLAYNDKIDIYSTEKDENGSLWGETYEGYYACIKLADGTELLKAK